MVPLAIQQRCRCVELAVAGTVALLHEEPYGVIRVQQQRIVHVSAAVGHVTLADQRLDLRAPVVGLDPQSYGELAEVVCRVCRDGQLAVAAVEHRCLAHLALGACLGARRCGAGRVVGQRCFVDEGGRCEVFVQVQVEHRRLVHDGADVGDAQRGSLDDDVVDQAVDVMAAA